MDKSRIIFYTYVNMKKEDPSNFIIYIFKHQLRARRFLFRTIHKLIGQSRPSSYPYPSGDSFRALADHIHDETGSFAPKDVKKGDIVFVSNPLTLQYLREIHPQIENPYILIEHNGDFDIGKEVADLIDDKIIKFYAQDLIYAHEKIVPIPIALENWHYYMNGIPSVFNRIKRKNSKRLPLKKDKVLYRFSLHTNPNERKPALEYVSKHPMFETFTDMLPPTLHIRKLTGYKFVVSPPGNAIESCRTWEALYVRTVPIVKDSVAMRYFVSLGLPIWIVKEWNELDMLNEETLKVKYESFMKNPNWEPLHMDFWIKLIDEDRKTYLK